MIIYKFQNIAYNIRIYCVFVNNCNMCVFIIFVDSNRDKKASRNRVDFVIVIFNVRLLYDK